MEITFTPAWFFSADLFIEAFSFLVLLIFFFLCWRNYDLSKKKSFLYLGLGFLLISAAEVSIILTKLAIFYKILLFQGIGNLIPSYTFLDSLENIHHVGFFIYHLMTLFGLYIIYKIPSQKKSFGDFVLGVYFIILSAFFSEFAYYLFHITTLILLILILGNYTEIYQKNKLQNTKILIIAFGILAISQLIFILSPLDKFYVAGEFLQLFSYVILSVLMVRIFRVSKKVYAK